jgi:2-polyprenyl-6-methoxyphenol hydroxylase-like FAD-dependent oxidoreductase
VIFEADWVIGTDGARSTVRKLAGLPFEGMTWPDRFVADQHRVPVPRLSAYANANMVVDPVNWCVIGRLGRENLWRTDLRRGRRARRGLDPRAPARAVRGDPARSVGAYRIDNFSPYRVHQRCTPTFRVGRVLLGGRRGARLQPVRRPRTDRRGDRRRHDCPTRSAR